MQSWVCQLGLVVVKFSSAWAALLSQPTLLLAGGTGVHGLSSPEVLKLLQTSLYTQLRATVGL